MDLNVPSAAMGHLRTNHKDVLYFAPEIERRARSTHKFGVGEKAGKVVL